VLLKRQGLSLAISFNEPKRYLLLFLLLISQLECNFHGWFNTSVCLSRDALFSFCTHVYIMIAQSMTTPNELRVADKLTEEAADGMLSASPSSEPESELVVTSESAWESASA
jgi:hypothetical protein